MGIGVILRNKLWETDSTEFAFHLLFMSNWRLDRSCCVENCEVSKVAIFQNVLKFGCHCRLAQISPFLQRDPPTIERDSTRLSMRCRNSRFGSNSVSTDAWVTILTGRRTHTCKEGCKFY